VNNPVSIPDLAIANSSQVQIVVEPVKGAGTQVCQWDLPNVGVDPILDQADVISQRGFLDLRLVDLKPRQQVGSQRLIGLLWDRIFNLYVPHPCPGFGLGCKSFAPARSVGERDPGAPFSLCCPL